MREIPDSLVAQYIHQWGNADSVALLDPRFSIFHVPHIQGMIGYRREAGRAVVFADPLCADHDIPILIREFHDYAQDKFKGVVYALASDRFLQIALAQGMHSVLQIGHELVLDPTHNILQDNGSTVRKLRNKFNHAKREGIVLKEYQENDPVFEKKLEEVVEEWLKGRTGLQSYHSTVDPFAHPEIKRWFYAEYNNRLVGLIILNRIGAYNGWMLNRLIILPNVPYGTSEFCVLSVLEILRHEGCTFFSVGTVPDSKLGDMYGLNVVYRSLFALVFKVARQFLELDGLQRYWQKFKPKKIPSYVLFNKRWLSPSDVIAIIRTFNVGG
jgi:lysylphosphatidylglycerol synthetase-like protein (DUF2156 family)